MRYDWGMYIIKCRDCSTMVERTNLFPKAVCFPCKVKLNNKRAKKYRRKAV